MRWLAEYKFPRVESKAIMKWCSLDKVSEPVAATDFLSSDWDVEWMELEIDAKDRCWEIKMEQNNAFMDLQCFCKL